MDAVCPICKRPTDYDYLAMNGHCGACHVTV